MTVLPPRPRGESQSLFFAEASLGAEASCAGLLRDIYPMCSRVEAAPGYIAAIVFLRYRTSYAFAKRKNFSVSCFVDLRTSLKKKSFASRNGSIIEIV